MFWLLSQKHYLVLSLLILTDIMIMTSVECNVYSAIIPWKRNYHAHRHGSMISLILESTDIQQAAELNIYEV
jgi:dolichyl-phosphate-mannose--protein O-mannosyl transferase